MKRTLKSVSEVIDALGGPSVLGDQLGIGQTAVSNWKIRNQIPAGWHLRVYLSLRQRGLDVKPSMFGLDNLDALEEKGTPSKRKRPSRSMRKEAHAA